MITKIIAFIHQRWCKHTDARVVHQPTVMYLECPDCGWESRGWSIK